MMGYMPEGLNYVVGALIIANVGTIGTVLFAAARGVWWLSKLDSRVTDAKDTAIRAHKRVDLLTQNSAHES